MKNEVKIVSVQFNDEFTNKNDIKQHTLSILINDAIIRGSMVKKSDDEDSESVKVLKKSDRINIDFKNFLKMLVLDDDLSQLDSESVNTDEELSWKDEQTLKYRHHLSILRGANIVIEREEVKEIQYKKDESGEIILDTDGNPCPQLDKDGNPVKALVGFGETSITSVKLTEGAKRRLNSLLEKQD